MKTADLAGGWLLLFLCGLAKQDGGAFGARRESRREKAKRRGGQVAEYREFISSR